MTARKSDEIKKLAGTFRTQRALTPDFAALLEELPVPPENMSAGAREQWAALGPSVIALGISSADLAAYGLLAETLATAEECRQQIAVAGYMIAAGKTGHRLHPAVPVMEHARTQAAALLTAFNLTPKSRVGTAVPTPRSNFGRDGRATLRGEGDEKAASSYWAQFEHKAPGDAA